MFKKKRSKGGIMADFRYVKENRIGGLSREDFLTEEAWDTFVKKNKEATTGKEIDPEGIDHPEHYNVHPSGVECIEVVRYMNFNLGNVIKYLWRDGIKNTEVPLQDLKKASWYLNDEILRRENDVISPKQEYKIVVTDGGVLNE
jgi:hypothetical protein